MYIWIVVGKPSDVGMLIGSTGQRFAVHREENVI
jgi:hypothetical protein